LILDFFRSLNFVFLSSIIWSISHYGEFRRKTAEAALAGILSKQAHQELQYKFARAQNAFLKQQINPHLLFNSLNAIYNTVYQNTPEASKSVLLLSDIMRYSFEEPGADGRVRLEDELLQLQNLIELNTYRFDHPILMDFSIEGNPAKYTIIPLILITLTENVFKHGNLRYVPATISAGIDETGQLLFTTSNAPKLMCQASETSSVGLANTTLRLDYAYPGNYSLELAETTDLFTVKLTLNLNS
jgi:two-component system LytT family sensor kinase